MSQSAVSWQTGPGQLASLPGLWALEGGAGQAERKATWCPRCFCIFVTNN